MAEKDPTRIAIRCSGKWRLDLGASHRVGSLGKLRADRGRRGALLYETALTLCGKTLCLAEAESRLCFSPCKSCELVHERRLRQERELRELEKAVENKEAS